LIMYTIFDLDGLLFVLEVLFKRFEKFV